MFSLKLWTVYNFKFLVVCCSDLAQKNESGHKDVVILGVKASLCHMLSTTLGHGTLLEHLPYPGLPGLCDKTSPMANQNQPNGQ